MVGIPRLPCLPRDAGRPRHTACRCRRMPSHTTHSHSEHSESHSNTLTSTARAPPSTRTPNLQNHLTPSPENGANAVTEAFRFFVQADYAMPAGAESAVIWSAWSPSLSLGRLLGEALRPALSAGPRDAGRCRPTSPPHAIAHDAQPQ